MTKPVELPPVGPARRPDLAPMEALYLRAIVHWWRFKHTAPSLGQLADLCRRSGAPTTSRGKRKPVGWPSNNTIYCAILVLEQKGYVRRNDKGRPEVIK